MKEDGGKDGIAYAAPYGREEFFEKAQKMIDESEPRHYILSCVNIDNFKVINAQYGTAVGDLVLGHVAKNVFGCMERMGGICGHIAADEFAALLPASFAKSELILQAHADATAPRCIFQRIRLRMGRYIVDASAEPVVSMYDNAKLAADNIRDNYERDVEYYKSYMRTDLVERQQIIYEMRGALANGQFEVWLQPQFNHATGAIIGAEVLVRWNKNGEYIPPSEFIPIFEQNGFIYELDKFVWEQSCKLLRRWIDSGAEPLPLSVNISRRDILHNDFISVLTGIIEHYGLSVDLIRPEITESAFAESSSDITERVTELIDRGFVVEIDDFGSGYSSLNTLKDVPAAILKLDMRFFESAVNNRRTGNIVEAVVRMAKWLGMAVIAEGVEDMMVADYLKSIGCYYIQGYCYAKPMRVEQYERLLSDIPKEQELSRLKTLETFDNNEFWNPKSMDTLIFNSYVGGACIFEYYKGRTNILRLNDRYISQLGSIVSPETELHGASVSKYMNERDRERFFGIIQKAIESHTEESCEVRLENDGHTEFVRMTVRAIARTDDRVMCYGVMVNVTEQRLAEINERNMITQLNAMMGSIHASVTAAVYEGHGSIRNIYTNNGFYEMYGYTKEQFENEVSEIGKLVLTEDCERVMATIERVVMTRSSETHEFRCRRRDGRIIWVKMTNTVVSLDGIGENVLMSVAMDITEQKEYHTQLEASDNAVRNVKSGAESKGK